MRSPVRRTRGLSHSVHPFGDAAPRAAQDRRAAQMTPESREDQLLDLIYDAAADPRLWSDVMERIVPMIGGEQSVMSRLDIVDGTGSAKVSGIDSNVLDPYFSHFFKVNPAPARLGPADLYPGMAS